MSLRPYDSSVVRDIELLYVSSFPASERFPFGNLISYAENGHAELLWSDDGGFAYILPSDGRTFLLYLAVVPEKRGKGIGSRMLQDLKDRSYGKTIFLNVEPPEGPEKELRLRRIGFYKRNGFRVSGDVTAPDGERYTLMSCGPDICPADAEEFYRGLSQLSGL